MSEERIIWCSCENHDHKDWRVVSDHYCRHFIPSGWALQYHTLDCRDESRYLYFTGICNVCGGFMRSGTSLPLNVSGAELLSYVYREMVRFRPFDGYDAQSGHYKGAVPERSKWYRKQDDLSTAKLEEQFVGLFQEKHQETAREWFSNCRPPRPYCNPCRDKKSTLFRRIMDIVQADNGIAEINDLLHYAIPAGGKDDTYLTDYRFDVVPHLKFGFNEGVVLLLMLEGSFDSSHNEKAVLGTLKTLRTDLEACCLMGALGGMLVYHARRYINKEIHRYTPEWQLAKEREKGEQCYGR